jgi:hypothetical protein
MNLVNATRKGKARNSIVTPSAPICNKLIDGRFRNAKKYKTCALLNNPDFKTAVNQSFIMAKGRYNKKLFVGNSSMPHEVIKCAQTMANYRQSTAICGGTRYGLVAGLSRDNGPKVGNARQNLWRKKEQARGTKMNYITANKLYGPEMGALKEQVIILRNRNKFLEEKAGSRNRNAVIDDADFDIVGSLGAGLRAPLLARPLDPRILNMKFGRLGKRSNKKSKKVAKKSVNMQNNIQKNNTRNNVQRKKAKQSSGKKSVQSLDLWKKKLYNLDALNYSQNYDIDDTPDRFNRPKRVQSRKGSIYTIDNYAAGLKFGTLDDENYDGFNL